jgi:hypothetical protein
VREVLVLKADFNMVLVVIDHMGAGFWKTVGGWGYVIVRCCVKGHFGHFGTLLELCRSFRQ